MDFYMVRDKHGNTSTFPTKDEAEAEAVRIMQGYLDGTLSANDPKPTIFAIQEIAQLGFNRPTKQVYRRDGGPNFGSYRYINI